MDVVSGCTVPPDGWRCTRVAGHDGPCAAVPDSRSLPDRAEPRRFLALIQDPRGYSTELEPTPPEGPIRADVFHVIKTADYEAAVERLRVENEKLKSVQQWQAVGSDNGCPSDYGHWRYSLEEAQADVRLMGAGAVDPEYDEVYIRTRWLSLPERLVLALESDEEVATDG